MAADALDDLFRDAVRAIDAGDLATLEALLAQHPRLACERLAAPGAWLRDKVGCARAAHAERTPSIRRES